MYVNNQTGRRRRVRTVSGTPKTSSEVGRGRGSCPDSLVSHKLFTKGILLTDEVWRSRSAKEGSWAGSLGPSFPSR